MLRSFALAALGIQVAQASDEWAVLIAGSNSFFNYRHQADVCHAYQLLTKRGVQPEKIITLMYDDVASSSMNPFPGKLYNYPWKSMDEAVDVYAGCKIDYRGKDVTPDKLVAVLTGDAATAGGRVLQSTAEDHVFVNFVDHGGVGLIAFPDGQPVLHANRLVSTLKDMHSKSLFKQLTFYLEACESGSMFEGLLPKDLPVYAVTAANAQESSWGTYCGANSTVGGKSVGSCLGDLFSVNWMMDTEKNGDSQETLLQQFQRVKQLTDKSHVMAYGQVDAFEKELVSDFEGGNGIASQLQGAVEVQGERRSTVASRDIKVDQLYLTYLGSGSKDSAKALVEEIQARQAAQDLGSLIKELAIGRGLEFGEKAAAGFTAWTAPVLACHEAAVAAFGEHCGWSEPRLALSKTLYQICSEKSSDAVLRAVTSACFVKGAVMQSELVV